MIEVTILIPLADNAGQEFSAPHFEAFETQLETSFGGCSRLPGEIRGTWLEGETKYADRLVQYLIALESITDGGKLSEVIDFAKAHFRQEAIYLRYLGMSEIR